MHAAARAGIADVRDESDRDGMRVVVEVKRGASPEVREHCPESMRRMVASCAQRASC